MANAVPIRDLEWCYEVGFMKSYLRSLVLVVIVLFNILLLGSPAVFDFSTGYMDFAKDNPWVLPEGLDEYPMLNDVQMDVKKGNIFSFNLPGKEEHQEYVVGILGKDSEVDYYFNYHAYEQLQNFNPVVSDLYLTNNASELRLLQTKKKYPLFKKRKKTIYRKRVFAVDQSGYVYEIFSRKANKLKNKYLKRANLAKDRTLKMQPLFQLDPSVYYAETGTKFTDLNTGKSFLPLLAKLREKYLLIEALQDLPEDLILPLGVRNKTLEVDEGETVKVKNKKDKKSMHQRWLSKQGLQNKVEWIGSYLVSAKNVTDVIDDVVIMDDIQELKDSYADLIKGR